jgi:hypothetical protein
MRSTSRPPPEPRDSITRNSSRQPGIRPSTPSASSIPSCPPRSSMDTTTCSRSILSRSGGRPRSIPRFATAISMRAAPWMTRARCGCTSRRWRRCSPCVVSCRSTSSSSSKARRSRGRSTSRTSSRPSSSGSPPTSSWYRTRRSSRLGFRHSARGCVASRVSRCMSTDPRWTCIRDGSAVMWQTRSPLWPRSLRRSTIRPPAR